MARVAMSSKKTAIRNRSKRSTMPLSGHPLMLSGHTRVTDGYWALDQKPKPAAAE